MRRAACRLCLQLHYSRHNRDYFDTRDVALRSRNRLEKEMEELRGELEKCCFEIGRLRLRRDELEGEKRCLEDRVEGLTRTLAVVTKSGGVNQAPVLAASSVSVRFPASERAVFACLLGVVRVPGSETRGAASLSPVEAAGDAVKADPPMPAVPIASRVRLRPLFGR